MLGAKGETHRIAAHILEKAPSDLRYKTTSLQLSHFILYLNIFYLIQKIDTNFHMFDIESGKIY